MVKSEALYVPKKTGMTRPYRSTATTEYILETRKRTLKALHMGITEAARALTMRRRLVSRRIRRMTRNARTKRSSENPVDALQVRGLPACKMELGVVRLTRNVFEDEGNNRQRYDLKILSQHSITVGLGSSFLQSVCFLTRIASRAPTGKEKRETHHYIHEVPVVNDEGPQPRRN